jgi:hypothetical protein
MLPVAPKPPCLNSVRISHLLTFVVVFIFPRSSPHGCEHRVSRFQSLGCLPHHCCTQVRHLLLFLNLDGSMTSVSIDKNPTPQTVCAHTQPSFSSSRLWLTLASSGNFSQRLMVSPLRRSVSSSAMRLPLLHQS